VKVLDSFRLDGLTAVVTGAGSGIGAATAEALACAGAHVVLMGRRTAPLDEVRARIEGLGQYATALVGDVTDAGDCDRVAAAAGELGSLAVLVNAAGLATAAPAHKESLEQFRQVLDVDLTSAYQMARACAARMSRGASIVNVASISAMQSAGLPQAAYSAAKAGLLGLTRDLAAQWTGRRGIRVNAVVPGFVETALVEACPPGYLSAVIRHAPIGRLGRPAEIAACVLFLASPASSFVTGIGLVADGGFSIVKDPMISPIDHGSPRDTTT
jgi:NAD(P)-dependent dehydrogenase (short-subunit alcohol dehydrogenase family)